jgi:hypothetical protein
LNSSGGIGIYQDNTMKGVHKQSGASSFAILTAIAMLLLASLGCGLRTNLVGEQITQTPSLATAVAATLDGIEVESAATETPQPTPTARATPTSTEVPSAFGIDYAHPERYLQQGEQSQISDPGCLFELRTEDHSLTHLSRVYWWLKDEFTGYSAGGRTIGVVNVDQLLAERRLGGCHDYGLVFAAAVREMGYPAVMLHANSIAWMEEFQAGGGELHAGHVFVEIYLEGRWILIDPTNGWYADEGYDPTNPVIPLRKRVTGSADELYGFYAESKGFDIWDFGVHSKEDTHQAMDEVARQVDLHSIVYPSYEFHNFSDTHPDS